MPDAIRTLLTARLTQLLTRAVTFVLVGLFGADLAAGDAGVSTVVTALVASSLALADVLIHRTKWGAAVEQWVTPASAAKLAVVLACALTPFAAALSGCGPSSGFYNAVREQWPPIGQDFRMYVNADPTLGPPGAVTRKRTNILRSADVMDAAIAAEGGKPFAPPALPAAAPTTGLVVPPPPAP